jgi:hypothetical protein
MAAEIKATITGPKGAQKLVLEIPVYKSPIPSGTGKSLVVASTRGNAVTDLVLDGKPVVVGVNAYLKLPKE